MKTKATRKLQLDRETLRQLDREALELARGGQTPVETIVRPTDACGTPTSK